MNPLIMSEHWMHDHIAMPGRRWIGEVEHLMMQRRFWIAMAVIALAAVVIMLFVWAIQFGGQAMPAGTEGSYPFAPDPYSPYALPKPF